MGCPDWPKCFGTWIPPTDIRQLPEDYKEIFKVQGREIADFNAFKTWIEYINRLLGALIGVFIFLTFLFSLAYLKKDFTITVLSFLLLILIGFQGWLGSLVVSSDLAVYMITAHMLVAIVVICLLIYIVSRSYQGFTSSTEFASKSLLNKVLVGCIVLSIVQIVLGTQVREAVDEVTKALGEAQRSNWIAEMNLTFYIHRSFSLVVLGLNIYFLTLLKKLYGSGSKRIFNWGIAIAILFVLEIFSGVIMAYFAIPPAMQPIHLLLANIVFGIQFYLLLRLNENMVFKTHNLPSSNSIQAT